MLSPAAATAFKLNLKSNPDIPYVIGMGGTALAYVTEVKSFTIFDITFPRVLFVVAGNDMPAGAAGPDRPERLAHRRRRVRPGKRDDPAHAAQGLQGPRAGVLGKDYGKPFTVIDLEWAAAHPITQGVAYLNGQKIRVMFDTGAALFNLDAQCGPTCRHRHERRCHERRPLGGGGSAP